MVGTFPNFDPKLVLLYFQAQAILTDLTSVSELLWGRALPHESLLIVVWARGACTDQGSSLELVRALKRGGPAPKHDINMTKIEAHTKKVI